MNKNEMNFGQMSIGICFGSTTISAVKIRNIDNKICLEQIINKPHEGNPRQTFIAILDEMGTNDIPIVVTGRKFRHQVDLPSISESEAIENAFQYSHAKNGKYQYDAIVSAGGETFIVYTLGNDNKINNIFTGNKCASGTGEFFVQQLKRMDISLVKAMEIGKNEGLFKVSGRCSVFCKSDCTHALNKGVPVSNIINGLCQMMAHKIDELVLKTKANNVFLIGGISQNRVVVDELKKKFTHLSIPENASCFEAFGAALAALKFGQTISTNVFLDKLNSFQFLEPLNNHRHMVIHKHIDKDKIQNGDTCIIGLDVGSTTTKAVLIREQDNALLGSAYLRTNGNPILASKDCFIHLMEQIQEKSVKIIGIGVTGSGRKIAGLYCSASGVVNEIIAHATAAVYFDPQVDTIFEIGGQDAKYTYITNGIATDYAMNEACSAGTGSFLEEAAYESLGVKMEEIAIAALKAKNPPNFNDQCAAFISSDIKTAIHEGINKEDILAGLVYSIGFNFINRVKVHRQIGNRVFLQGGVCYNEAVPLAMAGIIKKPIIVPPEPGLMGAFGVALAIKNGIKSSLYKRNDFDLKKIIQKQVVFENTFTCHGYQNSNDSNQEKCDLKCQINRIRLDNRTFPFGGACSKYYLQNNNTAIKENGKNLIKIRNDLMFKKYSSFQKKSKGALVIGLNKSFITHRLFPLYSSFFNHLGCSVILPEEIHETDLHRQATSMCYPAQIALGLFADLIMKNPDYIFSPQVTELFVPHGIKRKEFCSTCLLVRGEPFWLKQSFHDKEIESKVLSPTLNFSNGYEKEYPVFLKMSQELGFNKKIINQAYKSAVKNQLEFEQECRILGKKFLKELAEDKNQVAIILFGRPYNAYADLANKGIPQKITSLGRPIIPFDILPYEEEKLLPAFQETMHWEAGQRILRAAQIVRKHKQLYAVYLTNFLCGPDSFLLSYFRRIMGTKPSLTLELDNHTADAGINTRIEAFLDIISNYRETEISGHVQSNDIFHLLSKPKSINSLEIDQISPTNQKYQLAEIKKDNGVLCYFDSDNKKIKLTDPGVKLVLPNMGDLGTRAFACAFRKAGIKTESLPVPDREVLDLGRSVATGKECLPFLICIGSILKYLKYRKVPNERLAVFLPSASGYCRLGQYHVFVNIVLNEKKIRNVAILKLSQDDNYFGLNMTFVMTAWQSIVISDVMADILCSIWALAVNLSAAEEIFYREFEKILNCLEKKKNKRIYKQLEKSAMVLRQIPLKQPLHNTPHIAITGEIFVRRESFCNMNIARRIAEKGFVARTTHISEMINYANFMIKNKLQQPDFSLMEQLQHYVFDKTQCHLEKKIKQILARSGLYELELIDIAEIIKYSKHLIPPTLVGEPGLICGMFLKDSLIKYAGIVNIGPFGCMQLRFAEGVAVPQAKVKNKKLAFQKAGEILTNFHFTEDESIPFLTIEADGNPYPQLLEARFENFCIQSERMAVKMGKELINQKSDKNCNQKIHTPDNEKQIPDHEEIQRI